MDLRTHGNGAVLAMRQAKLIELAHYTARNPQRYGFPTCAHCTKRTGGYPYMVEAIQLENVNANSVEIVARCHGGKEDALKIENPTGHLDLQSEDFQMFYRQLVFFEGEVAR